MVAAVVVAAVGAGGCANFNLLSTQEEIALGQQVMANVEKDARLYYDPATVQYVQELGRRIAKVSDRQDVVYHFKVIEDHNTVNAFALPGGFIYVYTGLLRFAESEAELASVLAHETGHVAARHSAKHVSAEIGVSILLSLVLGENPGVAAALGTQVLKGVGFSRMSQGDEYEADQLGITYLKRAGYDPAALVAFLRKLNAEHGRNPSPLAQLFATHPLTQDRIARADALVAELGPGGRVGADTYRRRLARLMAEPAPPKKKTSGSGSSSFRQAAPAPTVALQAPQPRPLAAAAPTAPPAPNPRPSPARRQQERPMICRNLTKGNLVASRLEVATTAAARRKGLLGRSGIPPGGGLLLVPCRSVHTMGMKFPIDIVFITKHLRVARVLHQVKPGAVNRQCLKAHSVLELPAGTAATRRIELGDQLRITRAAADGEH